MIAIGLMSGTSLDGVDAALVRIRPQSRSYRIDLLNFQTRPFEPELGDLLQSILPPNGGSTERLARAHNALGRAFARAALEVQSDMPVDYVACHGQTVFHDGSAGVTLQLGDAFVIREAVATTVCYDFRSADCAAGGQGAPLVPYADALLLGSEHEDRVAVNIGGIANLTLLPRGCDASSVAAFDTGPGNMLVDALIAQRTGGVKRFDQNGELALRGRVNAHALARMLRDPYFAQPPPKTTGRERFGAQFLSAHEDALAPLALEDAAATLAALTVDTIADAVRSAAPAGARVIVSGGGVHNRAMFERMRDRLPGFRVEPSGALNLHADAKEAIAFAVLGYETLRGRAANVPSTTGAAHPAVLGAIAPHELESLMAKVQAECRK